MTTSKIRDGCSRPAAMLASMALGYSDSSQTMIKVSTMPWAGLPSAAPSAKKFCGDLRRRGVVKGDDHYGRLQLKPSRASMTSAPLGPHDPGSYGSGCSGRLAQ